MGQFSWKTSDTHERIIIGARQCIALIDKDNKCYIERDYEGYGVFGGKDAYALLAEMNAPEECNGNVDHDRLIGINLKYDTPEKIKYPIVLVEISKPEDASKLSYKDYKEAPDDPGQGWAGEDEEDDDDNGWF